MFVNRETSIQYFEILHFLENREIKKTNFLIISYDHMDINNQYQIHYFKIGIGWHINKVRVSTLTASIFPAVSKENLSTSKLYVKYT